MGFERVYQKLGVVIVEHALDEAHDLKTMDRAFLPRPAHGGAYGLADEYDLQDGLPADLADWLETHPLLLQLASRILAAPAQLIRVSARDEREPAHWLVPWRQMRTIRVTDRHRVAGFRSWTEKDGAWQVEPPLWVLEQTVLLRVYLDDCRAFDGPTEVLVNTHGSGRLRRVEIAEAQKEKRAMTCLCDRGDVLAISPLALRRRQRATKPRASRVLELTFSAAKLPAPLEWAPLTPDVEAAVAIW
jgi:hypothetical protein